ncbi:hypothetical protein H096_14263, partial [Pseudomonas sp. FH1]
MCFLLCEFYLSILNITHINFSIFTSLMQKDKNKAQYDENPKSIIHRFNIFFIFSSAVAGAECNTVIELKQ